MSYDLQRPRLGVRVAGQPLPATATVVGIIVLGQLPTPIEIAGVVLVVAGVAIHAEPATTPAPRTPVTR